MVTEIIALQQVWDPFGNSTPRQPFRRVGITQSNFQPGLLVRKFRKAR